MLNSDLATSLLPGATSMVPGVQMTMGLPGEALSFWENNR